RVGEWARSMGRECDLIEAGLNEAAEVGRYGDSGEGLLGLDVESWLERSSGNRLVLARDRGSRLVRRGCVNLRGMDRRHCGLERLIGRAVPVLASLSAGLRPSTITVSVSGNVMTCRRRMAESCRSVARLRSAAWCHRNQDRWRSQQR